MISQKHFGALRMAYLDMLWLHYLLFFVVSWPESRHWETLQQLLLVVRIQEQTKDYKHLAQLPFPETNSKSTNKNVMVGGQSFPFGAFRPIFRGELLVLALVIYNIPDFHDVQPTHLLYYTSKVAVLFSHRAKTKWHEHLEMHVTRRCPTYKRVGSQCQLRRAS